MVLEHIQKLLFDHDCVIMPDFGGLITHYEPAKIHPIRHTFLPPAKRVAFNEKLKLNDGLLISTLAYDKRLSTEEAQLLVARFVHQLQHDLNQHRRYDLKGIGIFRLNTENKVEFEYIENENYLNDSFGLPELISKPVLATEPVILRTLLKEQNIPAKSGFHNRIRRYYRAATALVIGGAAITGLYFLSLQHEYNVSSINPIALFQSNNQEVTEKVQAEQEPVKETVAAPAEVLPEVVASTSPGLDTVAPVTTIPTVNAGKSINQVVNPPASPAFTAAIKPAGTETVTTNYKSLAVRDAALPLQTKQQPAGKGAPGEVKRNYTIEEINAAIASGKVKVKPKTNPEKMPVKSKATVAKPVVAPIKAKAVPAPAAGTTVVKAKSERFYIIVNGYSTYENAERNRLILAKKGRPGQIIAPYGDARLYRIAIAAYDTKEQALQNLPLLKNKYGNTIWILKY